MNLCTFGRFGPRAARCHRYHPPSFKYPAAATTAAAVAGGGSRNPA